MAPPFAVLCHAGLGPTQVPQLHTTVATGHHQQRRVDLTPRNIECAVLRMGIAKDSGFEGKPPFEKGSDMGQREPWI